MGAKILTCSEGIINENLQEEGFLEEELILKKEDKGWECEKEFEEIFKGRLNDPKELDSISLEKFSMGDGGIFEELRQYLNEHQKNICNL